MNDAVFKKGSKTYYNASKFFPAQLRSEVTILYTFVRIVDDFVDVKPPEKKNFLLWKKEFQRAWSGKRTHIKEIAEFVTLAKKRTFKKEWIDSFFDSMEFDLNSKHCKTEKETRWYVHGSAEVIGLMMAQLMRVPKQAHSAASLLGRAMQYINFIRDVAEDKHLGRNYLQLDMQPRTTVEKVHFAKRIQQCITQYKRWTQEAATEFRHIPYPARIAVMTASDMYLWTSKQIEKNPFIVFERKVKPKRIRILLAGMKNTVKALWI